MSNKEILYFICGFLPLSIAATSVEFLSWLLIPILLITYLLHGNKNFNFGILEYCLLLIIFSAITSLFLSDYISHSLIPTLYFVGYYLLILLLIVTLRNDRQWRCFLWGATLGYFTLVLFSLLGGNQPDETRLLGVLGQENATGSMASASAVTVTILWLTHRSSQSTAFLERLEKSLILLIFVSSVSVVVLSASRGAFISLALFLVIMGAFNKRMRGFLLGILIAALILTCAAGGLVFDDLFIVSRLHQIAYEFGLADTAPMGRYVEGVGIRSYLMEVALDIFQDNPIFGSGLGTFQNFSAYVYTHTTLFEFIYSLGLFGTVPYLCILSFIFFRSCRAIIHYPESREVAVIVLAVSAYYILQGFTLTIITSRMHIPILVMILYYAKDVIKLRKRTRLYN